MYKEKLHVLQLVKTKNLELPYIIYIFSFVQIHELHSIHSQNKSELEVLIECICPCKR